MYWKPGGGCVRWRFVRVLLLGHRRWWRVGEWCVPWWCSLWCGRVDAADPERTGFVPWWCTLWCGGVAAADPERTGCVCQKADFPVNAEFKAFELGVSNWSKHHSLAQSLAFGTIEVRTVRLHVSDLAPAYRPLAQAYAYSVRVALVTAGTTERVPCH